MKLNTSPVAQSVSPQALRRSAEIRKLFLEVYGGDCRLFRAPGRINLIGEHTDYNDGFVMPAAIDLHCWVAIRPAANRAVEVYSSNFNENRSFDLDQPQSRGDWSDYVQGVAIALERSGYRFPGAKMLISSELVQD
jgi:galactokinase